MRVEARAHAAGGASAVAVAGGARAEAHVHAGTSSDAAHSTLDLSPRHQTGASPISVLTQFPVPARALIALGAVVAIAGLVLGLTGAGALGFLLRGGFLVAPAVGLLGLGGMKRNFEQRELRTLEARRTSLIEVDAARIRELIRKPDPAQTIEWLVGQSGLKADAVIRALAHLRERDLVVEELNTESGEWFYFEKMSSIGSASDLDSRLKALEGTSDRRP